MGIGSVPRPRTPSMASLVQKAWQAKRRKTKELATTSQAPVWPKKKLLQSVPRAKEKPTYSPLLSRRLGKRILMTIKVPPRTPFPPPLVWKPPPRPPPPSPGRRYARPFARPPPRPRRCKRPENSMSHQYECVGH